MAQFRCPYLETDVDWIEERERHVAERHPDLLPAYMEQIAKTLADPDLVPRSERSGSARLFSRWYSDVRGGKHIVVVMSERASGRCWIVTA